MRSPPKEPPCPSPAAAFSHCPPPRRGVRHSRLRAELAQQDHPHRGAVPGRGSADLSARLLADHLKNALGQPVVVESKVGAGGNLAASEAARADADGHTLFIGTNGTQTINQSLYRKIPYDPAADFAASR